MPGPRWIKRAATDPFLRDVLRAELVPTMGTDQLFALRLSCGHTGFTSAGKTKFSAPETARCRVCLLRDLDSRRPRARLTPAKAALTAYVNGADVGVMTAARTVIALERLS
jgi:hypothetical protein